MGEHYDHPAIPLPEGYLDNILQPQLNAMQLALAVHRVYRAQAPQYGYKVQPFEELTDEEQQLAIAVCRELIDTGVVLYPVWTSQS